MLICVLQKRSKDTSFPVKSFHSLVRSFHKKAGSRFWHLILPKTFLMDGVHFSTFVPGL